MFPWMTQDVELHAEASPAHVAQRTASEAAEVSAAAPDAAQAPPQPDGSGDADAPLPHTSLRDDDEEAAEGAAETIRGAKRHKATVAGLDAATMVRVDVARAVLASSSQGAVPSQADLEDTADLLQEGPSVEALATALRLGKLSEETAVALCGVTLTDRISHTRALVLLRCMVRIVRAPPTTSGERPFGHGDCGVWGLGRGIRMGGA